MVGARSKSSEAWEPVDLPTSRITTTFDLAENTPVPLPPSPKHILRSHLVRITSDGDITRDISPLGRDANVTSTRRVESTHKCCHRRERMGRRQATRYFVSEKADPELKE